MPVALLTPSRFSALRQAPLGAPPHTVHPLSIHRPDNRLGSPPVAPVRFSAFSASRHGKSDGGERRRTRQQGLISPWSQVRIPPPPPHLACRSQILRILQVSSTWEILAMHPLQHPFSCAQAERCVRVV